VTAEDDRREILRLHREWWASNQHGVGAVGADIARMRPCFPDGDAYLMYNLSGHPYFGIDEQVELWEHYGDQIDIPEPPQVEVVRLELRGDMAWLAARGSVELRRAGREGTGTASLELGEDAASVTLHVRSTEVFQRDDGNGNPLWRMWHFHGSLEAAQDEPRPGFGDTYESRDLGRERP
jgi:hypothetical protein